MTLYDLIKNAQAIGNKFTSSAIPLSQDVILELDYEQGRYIVNVKLGK